MRQSPTRYSLQYLGCKCSFPISTPIPFLHFSCSAFRASYVLAGSLATFGVPLAAGQISTLSVPMSFSLCCCFPESCPKLESALLNRDACDSHLKSVGSKTVSSLVQVMLERVPVSLIQRPIL